MPEHVSFVKLLIVGRTKLYAIFEVMLSRSWPENRAKELKKAIQSYRIWMIVNVQTGRSNDGQGLMNDFPGKHGHDRATRKHFHMLSHIPSKVRNTPSRPRSWANFNLFLAIL
jgi:hypothetical protein